MNNTDTAAIEALRSFAIGHAEVAVSSHSGTQLQLSAFAHMCTAAIQGEAWAVERLNKPLLLIGRLGLHPSSTAYIEAKIEIILATCVTRPDAPPTTSAITSAIEALRDFAIGHAEVAVSSHSGTQLQLSAFARMCTAAIAGEEWAVERLEYVIAETIDIGPGEPTSDAWKLTIILEADCTRPDGAIARSISL